MCVSPHGDIVGFYSRLAFDAINEAGEVMDFHATRHTFISDIVLSAFVSS